ncbi:MAG: hypothetical protein JSV20_02740 [Candidatus Bathyarchaeota archaeon]|nr:MAG: hypothetical protein JSV20_02740 [Candidatus Bathyarchaeota archaeon]
MAAAAKESLETIEQRILSRVSSTERNHLIGLLRNAVLFIKLMRGEPLAEEEKSYPAHKLLSHSEHFGGKEAAATLAFRLELIDRYQLQNANYIEQILTLDYPAAYGKRLTARKALILRELYEAPTIPKYKLAKKIGSSSRVITRELNELQHEFAFQIITSADPQKFRLINQGILFRTKSTRHAEQLENFLHNQKGFNRTFQLDRDMLRGIIVFRYPDQQKAHRLFEERIRWLQDEFFIECHLSRLTGFAYSLSFATYDPEINAFSFDPEIVSEAPFTYIKQHLNTLPPLQGCDYGGPIRFDRADFLLAHSLYSSGYLGQTEFKQNLLKQHGFDFSKKTIWRREQRLRKESVSTPIIDMQIPGFDEYISIFVFCSTGACKTICGIPSFLPYVIYFSTDSGCILHIQRPAHTSALTGQLIRALQKEPGVSEVKLLRYQWQVVSPRHVDIVDRWNEELQKWEILEGDI